MSEELYLDFINDHLNYRRRGHRGKQELIAKALGLHLGNRRVLDLTAGLGQDAVFLVQLGFTVTGVERNAKIFSWLDDALKRATVAEPEMFSRLKFIHADGKDVVRTLQDIDAVYIDPMFPHKKGDALPRKEMVIFRGLVGDDTDAVELFQAALQGVARRIVVKRPIKAAPLFGEPVHSFKGKTIRYDLYIRH